MDVEEDVEGGELGHDAPGTLPSGGEEDQLGVISGSKKRTPEE